MLKLRFKKTVTAAMLVATMAMGGMTAAHAETVLKVVPHADLKILDPVWTTAFITRNHGYMIYDTLFGVDDKGTIHPQMVDTYSVSSDNKEYTFKLRPGLLFSDGAPVTSEDVIQSIKRWAARDNLGMRMIKALDSFTAVDSSTFKMTFKVPFGAVLDALSKPASIPCFIMPKRVAETDPFKQITETVGSGPYVFDKTRYRPGERVVYLKNTKYVPRKEAPSGTAGGKNVYVDELDYVILKDPQTMANALVKGEVDMIENVPSEQYATLKKNPEIKMGDPTIMTQSMLHLNHLIPPFNNPKIAQAALMAINQTALLRAQQVHKELYRPCASIYPCSSQYASKDTEYFTGKPQFAKAKALLKEAGYDGTPVVLMNPAENANLNKYPPVMAELLRQAGFKVDMQSMDWATLVSRRTLKLPTKDGGWNAFITNWNYGDTFNPLFFAPLTGSGEKGWFGWTDDPLIEQYKDEFIATSDPAERKRLATEIQKRVYLSAVYGNLGEFVYKTAMRKNVSGLITAPVGVFWNLKKE